MASAKDLARRLTEITMTDLDDKDRQLLIRESRRLHHRLMAPAERVPTMMWTEPWTLVAVKVAMDMELFAVLERGPLSSEQAAGTIGADPLLVGRICRLLGTQDIIEEVDVDTFINTEFSKSLADPKSVRNGFEHFYDVGIPQLEHTPDYLRRTKWQAPDDTADAPFGHLMGMSTERLGYWDWLQKHPQASEHFNLFLGSLRGSRHLGWSQFYPFQERLLTGFDKSKPLVVDIGGGNGSELRTFQKLLPNEYREATLVLQEQPHVIEEVKKTHPCSDIILQEHDFFQPQSQRFTGARAYVMGFILHDWPDKQALQILEHVKDAMIPAYSKLILHESVLADRVADITPRAAAMDLNMMAHFGSLERTRTQWECLLKKAVLRVTEVFDSQNGTHSNIEAVLDE